MKKIFAISLLSLVLAAPAFAALPTEVNLDDVKITKFADIINLADKLINYLFTALIVTAIVFIIISGFNWLSSGGDPTKTEKARNMLLYALIAIAIGALAKGLVYMVANLLGVKM